MAESSDGTASTHCTYCQTPFPDSARFCSHCGSPRFQLRMRDCLMCHIPIIPNAAQCPYCFAPQDPQILQHMPSKKCSNPQCHAPLLLASQICYSCRQTQQPFRMQYNQSSFSGYGQPSIGHTPMQIAMMPDPESSMNGTVNKDPDKDPEIKESEPKQPIAGLSQGEKASSELPMPINDDKADFSSEKKVATISLHNSGAIHSDGVSVATIGNGSSVDSTVKVLSDSPSSIGVTRLPTRASSVGVATHRTVHNRPQYHQNNTIVFHALIPHQLWHWDEQSTVYIKFFRDTIGQLNEPMIVVRNFEDLKELKCELKVNHDALSDNIQYKYYVHTSVAGCDQPEYIYCNIPGISSEHTNRILKVNRGFHQYDTTIFPLIPKTRNPEDKRVTEMLKNAFSYVRNRVAPDDNTTDAKAVRKRCLEVYLHDKLEALCAGTIHASGDDFVTSVAEVYTCLSNVWIQENLAIKVTKPISRFQNLEEDIKRLLLSPVEHHKTNNKSTSSCSVVTAAALIICCFQKIEVIDTMQSKDVHDLLSLIFSFPAIQNQCCFQLNVINTFLGQNDNLKNLLCNGIKMCCKRLIRSRKGSQYLLNVWQAAFLIYLMNNYEVPVQNLNQVSKYIQWLPQGKHKVYWEILTAITAKIWNPDFLLRAYHNLESWFKIYIQFLPHFIWSLSKNVYEKFFVVLNPFYSISRTAFLMNKENIEAVKKWLLCISTKIKEDEKSTDAIQVSQILDATEYLMESFTKINHSHMSTLYLQGISLVIQVYSLHICCKKDILPNYEKLIFYLAVYVAKEIGGHHFGCDMHYSSGRTVLQKPKQEFEMWDKLLSLECSPEIMKIWESVVVDVLLSRIQKLDSLDGTIEALAVAEARKVTKPLVRDCITKNLDQSLKIFINKPDCSISDESRAKIEQSEIMSALLVNLLPLKYPDFDSQNFNLEDILKWNVWPTLLRIHARQSSKLSNPPCNAQDICHTASNIVTGISSAVKDGSITVSLLEKINGKQASMEKLYAAVSHASNVFNRILSSRLNEYNTFISLQGQLSTLVQELQNANVSGLDELKKNLKLDISTETISSLCYQSDGQVVIPSFQSAAPLFPILHKFTILTQVHPSNTFQRFWNEQIEQYYSKNLLLGSVTKCIWMPVFEHCCKYLESLKDRTIKLYSVDELLDQFSESSKLEEEIYALHKGICKCSEITSDPSWIKYCVQRMQQYHSLRQYGTTAKALLNLKEALALTGDFKLIEQLAAKFEISVHDQCLQFVDDSLLKTGEFLHRISSDNIKLHTLETFSECQHLIKWIRNQTKNAQDLQQLINLALAHGSSGEDDYTQDAISNLQTVCNGFATLIYHIPTNTGYHELEGHLNYVWEALEREPGLTNKLNDCGKQIEWYKLLVKKLQSSEEETSISQMKNINQFGCYTVGTQYEAPCSKLSELIKMNLERFLKQGVQQNYTVDELKHLQSKLVLILGNDSSDKDHFGQVFNTVCHIAEVLIQLQQQGHSEYVGWVLKFSCNHPGIIDKLTAALKKMTKDLEEWQKMVDDARKRFYCLNYYTTQQLLLLRKELCHLVHPSDMKPDVLTLLMSLSREVTADLVVPLINQVNEENDEDEWTVHTQDNHFILQKDTKDIREIVETAVIPQAKLKVHTLTTQQNIILANLVRCYDKELILLAFENVKNPDIEEEVDEWCAKNEDKLTKEEGSAGLNFDSTHQPKSETFHHETGIVEQHSSASVVISQPVPMISIDENHPVVKQLLLAGYKRHLAIEAATKYPENARKAIEHIDQSDGNKEMKELLLIANSYRKQQTPDTKNSIAGVTKGIEISCNESNGTYFSLLKLAKLLNRLSNKFRAPITCERNFPKSLKQGEPNLLVVHSDQVIKTVLYLYMENEALPLPTFEEVLICNSATTTEEVTLFWKRAMGDPSHFRIFCLVNADLLSYQVCDDALRSLAQCSQRVTGYKLVIVCGSKNQDKSYIVSKLQSYKRPFFGVIYDDQKFCQYLMHHFSDWPNSMRLKMKASSVDPDKSYVRLVTSERPGMGKTLCIKNFSNKRIGKFCHIVIPLHGPEVTRDTFVKMIKKKFDDKKNRDSAVIFHIDISPSVVKQVDCILFCLLILQAVSDSQGRVWRCHPAHYYVIEATISKNERSFSLSTVALLDLLPKMICLSPRSMLNTTERGNTKFECSLDSVNNVIDLGEFQSKRFQLVYQYLRRQSHGRSLDKFCYDQKLFEGSTADCLEVLLRYYGVKDPSWCELSNFVTFLGKQLDLCERSTFCGEAPGETLSGLKTFTVKFMIRMSKDFATSNLKGEVIVENQDAVATDIIEELQIDERKLWAKNHHSYLFFNQDQESITFIGFNVNSNGDLLDPQKKVIERGVMKPQLHQGLKINQVDLSEDCSKWNKSIMIQKLAAVMGLKKNVDPDKTYVLTIDNVIKMMAIQMRFRCSIPVILMGETGCGKTRLIRYMCDLAAHGATKHVQNMLIMKIHGGTSKDDVVEQVEAAEKLAKINKGVDTVLFFDEANTSDAICLIKEVMCDRCVNGRPIVNDVKFIAACNPYRKHTDKMISKLESAGLGFFVKASETKQKLGKIPLRQLVYRVIELPPSMRPLVYDFGQINDTTAKDYIKQIVQDRCREIAIVKGKISVADQMAKILIWCQEYMRRKKDECSFVSLRDIERAMTVFKYFCLMDEYIFHCLSAKALKEGQHPVDTITRSLILAVSVCYHAKLQDRTDFEDGIVQNFITPLKLTDKKQFCNEIRWCQDIFLDNMKLGPNIARNTALRENVFMMVICIELRIPLFLVGKPGSSKSLAKSIVATSMLGAASESDLMRRMKAVQIFSYQCSQLSTSESIVEVFNTAKSYQNKQGVQKFVSVVVLDEVGLAEDSPNLPLKALHPLLEDGTVGGDGSGEIISPEQRVAFIGISNWALDPAKMNRGVMVTRGDPDETELELTARGMCSNVQNDLVRDKLASYFKPLSAAYNDICAEQEKNKRFFFGLRDFYSLIKMLYWMCKETEMQLTGPQLQHAIKRNFGGLDSNDIDTERIFGNYLKELKKEPDISHITDEKLRKLLVPDCSPLGLIKRSLLTKDISWHGENRYLLFLTQNYAALQVLKHYLYKEVGLTHEQKNVSLEYSQDTARVNHCSEPFLLFGSSFPKDREFTQVCRNINKIKVCMETGRMVILLNLDNLYESLYDLLNQYYIQLGDQRYVDLGLQTHRVKCRVHNNFKLILVAEKGTVYSKFPIPLINRLEKHFVLTETILTIWQREVYRELMNWVDDFGKVENFSVQDAFVGYQNDTPASVVFQATQQLQQEWGWTEQEHEYEERWKRAVLARSKKILLQMSSPDALIRLKLTKLDHKREKLLKIYYSDQHHGSMVEFLNYHFTKDQNIQIGLMIQVTTHSQLLSDSEINALSTHLGKKVSCFFLQDFDTEIDFTRRISLVFSNCIESLLIIQCDSGHLYGDLIACARHRIEDERQKVKRQGSPTHVIFIINLPHQFEIIHDSAFTGFQGGTWISAHIDSISISSKLDISLEDTLNTPISQLFYSEIEDANDIKHEQEHKKDEMDDDITEAVNTSQKNKDRKKHVQCIRLYDCIQAAVAKMLENNDEYQQSATSRINLLLTIIPEKPEFPLDITTFYGALVKHIKKLLQQRENIHDKDWVLTEAISPKKLHGGGTFQNVLIRKFHEVVVPLLSNILLFVDQYSNLSLLKQESHKQLWLTIFSNEDIVQFNYQSYIMNQGIGYQLLTASKNMFDCQFPFFWLIKEAISSKLDMVSGDNRNKIHIELCDILSQSAIGEALSSVPNENWKTLSEHYLGDIIRSSHHVTHQCVKKEYEILGKALHAITNGNKIFHTSLLSHLAAIHLVYHEYEQEIMWFGQLTSIIPGILLKLSEHNQFSNQCLELPLLAVKAAIGPDSLALPLDPESKQFIPQRLRKLQLCQNIIDSILSLMSCHELAKEIRFDWNRVRVIQLFIEHVAIKYSKNDSKFFALVQYAGRIDVKIGKQCDFSKKGAILKLQETLKELDRKSGTVLNYNPDMQMEIRNYSNSFFMEVVSSLCFGQPILPEPGLVEELFKIVFAEGSKTKIFSFSDKENADQMPVIRSFLLQLLLEHSTNKIEDQLSEYFAKAQQVFKNDNKLCLLCIQCLEDAIYKKHGQASLTEQIEHCCLIFQNGQELFERHTTPSIKYLEGVAKLRYSFTVVAELIYYKHHEDDTYIDNSQRLLDMAKTFCRNATDDYGSGVFLAKQIARKYGLSFFNKLIEDPGMMWLVPKKFTEVQGRKNTDPFVIYVEYTKFRTLLKNVTYRKEFAMLEANTANLSPHDNILLLFAIYQIVTGSAEFGIDTIRDETRTQIMAAVRKCKGLKKELMWVAKHLIEDTYSTKLKPMTIRPDMNPQDRLLTDLIVHVAIVMQYKNSMEILTPFIQMMNDPKKLKTMYLPTMPEDPLPFIRAALNGQGGQGNFYKCPNGHPYFISECGRPWTRSTCNVCKLPIGGASHKPDKGNIKLGNIDNTETGYALGQPHQREAIPSTERSLSPSACAIIRVLMHCSLLWCSCTNEHTIQDLLTVIKAAVKPSELSLFFWQHLKCDIDLLSKAIGKSKDDACALMHIILKQITTDNTDRFFNVHVGLKTRENRQLWEKKFFEVFIQPVLANVDTKINQAIELQLNDKKTDGIQLSNVIYEMVNLAPNVTASHLWSYHSRITLEHLQKVLQAQKDVFPILYEFLLQEPLLRATQYLPNIVKLQHQMYQLCHRKLDRKDLANITLGKYIEVTTEKKEFNDQVKCLKKAWKLAKGKLKDHSRIQVNDTLIQEVTWDESTPLSCLVPTLTGEGACTAALIDLLVGVHNEFLEKCQMELKKKQKNDIHWRMPKIPISHAQSCHLLDYEHQIISIVLSHCQYSLEYGKGQKVEYDLSALEKHIVDRFIHGKPILQLEIPQVTYRKEVYSIDTFDKIRKNVPPQQIIPEKQQSDILNELGSMQHLRDCLRVVEIVIGFLSSCKESHKMELRFYISNVLKMEKMFKSEKALDYCKLGHILSLWEAISVEIAKRHILSGQEPFDDFNEVLLNELQHQQKDEIRSFLRGIEVNPFLNLFYEFIETTVRHSEAQNCINWPLKDAFQAHLERIGLDPVKMLPVGFMDNFPESIEVGQSVATWKVIVFHQQTLEQQL